MAKAQGAVQDMKKKLLRDQNRKSRDLEKELRELSETYPTRRSSDGDGLVSKKGVEVYTQVRYNITRMNINYVSFNLVVRTRIGGLLQFEERVRGAHRVQEKGR